MAVPEGLIIVESPAKARTLKRFLGDRFDVRASMGHVRDLPDKELGVDVDSGFKPHYQVVEDRQVQERGFIIELPHTKIGRVRATASPLRLSRTAVRLDHAGPVLGEHTAEVLASLGLDEGELADLEQAGVVAPGTVPAASVVDGP